MGVNALHIASVLVQVQPESLAGTLDWLHRQRGCEVHGQDASGKVLVVMESADSEGGEQNVLDLIEETGRRPGVLDAALIYHELLDQHTADEPQPPLSATQNPPHRQGARDGTDPT